MQPILLVVGVVVLVATILDMLATTLSPATRAGLVTRRVGRAIWDVLRRRVDDGGSRWLVLAGPTLLALAVVGWMSGLLLGWWLVFLSGGPSVVDATTRASADAGEVLWFVGYAIFTLGNGGFAPAGTPWQVATVLATANGLLMATLAITYMVPVVTAVTQRRQLASTVSGLGHTVPEILRTATAGEPWVFDKLLLDLSSQVVLTAERHLAYPLIHFFHTHDRSTAFAPTVAALDEVVGILLADADGPWQADTVALLSFRRSVERLLVAAESPHLVHEAPPPPALPADVRSVVGEPARVAGDEHRRRLANFVVDSAWEWRDVAGDPDEQGWHRDAIGTAGAAVR